MGQVCGLLLGLVILDTLALNRVHPHVILGVAPVLSSEIAHLHQSENVRCKQSSVCVHFCAVLFKTVLLVDSVAFSSPADLSRFLYCRCDKHVHRVERSW